MSWRQRVLEIKFPADPELRREWTGLETSKAVSITTVVGGRILKIEGFTKLTMGC